MTQLEHLTVRISAETAGLDRGLVATASGVKGVGGAAATSTLNINRLSGGFLALASQATGANPIIARLLSVLSAFGLGMPVTVGLIGAAALIGVAWKGLTKDAKELEEGVQKMIDKMKEFQLQQQFGAKLPHLQAIADAQASAEMIREQMAERRASIKGASTGFIRGSIDSPAQMLASDKKLANWQQELDDLTAGIDAHKAALLELEPVNEMISAGVAARRAALLKEASAVTLVASAYGDLGITTSELMERAERWRGGTTPEAAGIVAGFMGGAKAAGGGIDSIPALPANFGTANNGFTGPANPIIPQASTISKVGGALKDMGGAVLGILSALNPWQILLDAIGRALGDFLVNMTPIVEILAAALMPILKALFPIFKMLAVAATYVGQVMFTVSGWILLAVGNLVKGLGKFLDAIPFLGDFGLVKAGNALIDLGKGFGDASDELGKARDDINALEWKDALDPLTQAANETAEALRNVPSGFKVALARFNATDGASTTNASRTAAASGGVTITGPVTVVANNPEEFARQIRQKARRGGAVPLRPAYGE